MATPLPAHIFTLIIDLSDAQRVEIEDRAQSTIAVVKRDMRNWLLTHLLWTHEPDQIDRPIREITRGWLADSRAIWTIIMAAGLEGEHDDSYPSNYTLTDMARAVAAKYLRSHAYAVYKDTLREVLAHKLVWSIHLKRYVSRDEHERLVRAGEEHYGD